MITNYPPSIPAAIGACVDKLRTALLAQLQAVDGTIETVNYMFGNFKEVQKRLQEMSDYSVDKTRKFPVIILLEDIRVRRQNTTYYGITQDMEIIIACDTRPEFDSEKRETVNFEPILRPMYHRLIYEMANSSAFAITSEYDISHDMIERKYWGTENNTLNSLGDYIDAIHLENIEITVKYASCEEVTGAGIG